MTNAMGMPQVYAATWRQTDVAVKCILSKEGPAEREFFEEVKPMSEEELEFLREIKLMSELNHTNIVTFYSASMQPGKVRRQLPYGSIRVKYGLIGIDFHAVIGPMTEEELNRVDEISTISKSHTMMSSSPSAPPACSPARYGKEVKAG